jgi:hypothetical protein
MADLSPLLGIRIKAIEGDTGTISGVTYEDIILTDITKYVSRAADLLSRLPTNTHSFSFLPDTVS